MSDKLQLVVDACKEALHGSQRQAEAYRTLVSQFAFADRVRLSIRHQESLEKTM